jgi:hypothetical protein
MPVAAATPWTFWRADHCCVSPQGEELTLDYGQETESEKEQRAAVCLCGADACRGSFLTYASHAAGAAQPQQQVSWLHGCVVMSATDVLEIAAANKDGRHSARTGRIVICSRPPAVQLQLLMPLRHLQACTACAYHQTLAGIVEPA